MSRTSSKQEGAGTVRQRPGVEAVDVGPEGLGHPRDGARADGVLQEERGERPHLAGADPADERRPEELVDAGLPALVAGEDLGLEAGRPGPRDREVAEQAELRGQIPRGGPVPVVLPVGRPLVPTGAEIALDLLLQTRL